MESEDVKRKLPFSYICHSLLGNEMVIGALVLMSVTVVGIWMYVVRMDFSGLMREDAQVEVLEGRVESLDAAFSLFQNKLHKVHYRFRYIDGRLFEGFSYGKAGQHVLEGSQVKIEVADGHPETAVVAGMHRAPLAYSGWVFPLWFVCLSPGILLLMGLSQGRGQLRLARGGSFTWARRIDGRNIPHDVEGLWFKQGWFVYRGISEGEAQAYEPPAHHDLSVPIRVLYHSVFTERWMRVPHQLHFDSQGHISHDQRHCLRLFLLPAFLMLENVLLMGLAWQ